MFICHISAYTMNHLLIFVLKKDFNIGESATNVKPSDSGSVNGFSDNSDDEDVDDIRPSFIKANGVSLIKPKIASSHDQQVGNLKFNPVDCTWLV
jgi:hypothetical protein